MSFINPLYLFALSAALLPVLYHLVRKMQAKKMQFSSLMFLKATPKELVRKRRLRDLLLMAVRAAIFALLALAFARPFIPEEHIPLVAGREQESVVLLVDNSYSMQHGGLFDEARERVLKRIEEAESGDEIAIVVFSDYAEQLTPLGDDHTLQRNIAENQLQPGNRTTDFYKAFRLAEEILQDARHTRRVVVLFSDFQDNGWSGSFDNWNLASNIRFVPEKMIRKEPANAYVQAFELTQRRSGEQVALRYDARIASQGERGAANTLRLTDDNATLEERRLETLASMPFSFQRLVSREGVFQGELAIGDDDLSIDNHYYFTYEVQQRPALLGIDGGGSAGPRDVFFLSRAFDLGEDALYRFSEGTRSQLSLNRLQAFKTVFLANIASLAESEVRDLRTYVENGGSLIISFGDQVNPRAFSTHLQELGIGRLEGIVNVREQQPVEAFIGEVDLRHAVFRAFAASNAGAILRPEFRQYARIAPDSNAVVIGKYDTEDPFLIERQLGSGKVLVYTSTFSTGWTDFPVNEIYVPFVYELVRYALSGSDKRRAFIVGDLATLRGRPGEEWEVRAPGERLYQVRLDPEGTGYFRETEEPGQYLASNGRERLFFSVNVDTKESDLQARDQEEAYAAVVAPSASDPDSPEQDYQAALEADEKRQKFWRYLILLIVALFAFETVYANRTADGIRRISRQGSRKSAAAERRRIPSTGSEIPTRV